MTDTRPRVLHVVLSLDPGGTEKLVMDLVEQLLPVVSPRICCLDGAGAWAERLEALGAPVTALHRRSGFRLAVAAGIRRLARAHRADVLHCHHYSPFVYGAIAGATLPGVQLLYTEHGRLSDAAPTRKRRVANLLLGRVGGEFYSVSEVLKRHMVAEGLPAERISVIPNGVQVPDPPSEREMCAARQLLGAGDESLVIGTVARLDPVKDLGTLLAAFARLRAELPRAELVVVGDGAERHTLETAAQSLGVSTAIHFLGQRDDVGRLLPGFDIYVNCSITEGISVTILEAMAAAIPVVATRVGGTPEIIEHQHSGLLIPARDPDALVGSLLALTRDEALRSRIGCSARDRVKTRFSLERMTRAYHSRYLAACGRPALGAGTHA